MWALRVVAMIPLVNGWKWVDVEGYDAVAQSQDGTTRVGVNTEAGKFFIMALPIFEPGPQRAAPIEIVEAVLPKAWRDR